MDSETLPADERLRLQKILRQGGDARQYKRALAVLECSRGKSIADIAKLLQVSRQSVSNWVGRYRQTHDVASLKDDLRSGRPSCWSKRDEALLKIVLGARPDLYGYFATQWTVPLLQEQLWHSTGKRFSGLTVRRCLHRLGYVWKRARYVLDPDTEREKKTPNSVRSEKHAKAWRTAGRG
jgi:transposase